MIKTALLALADRLTSLAVGATLTWLAATLHIVVDPQTQPALVALAVLVVGGGYDVAARFVAKRVPWLAPFLGVSPAGAR